jgi:coenzyme Q-binding protein COQ10
VPGEVVEAVSGAAATTIPREALQAAGYVDGADTEGQGKTMDGIFESLITRWTVQPAAANKQEWTDVTLSVTFQFSNPALGFAVGQMADEKVDEMVKAFEGRARTLYGRR